LKEKSSIVDATIYTVNHYEQELVSKFDSRMLRLVNILGLTLRMVLAAQTDHTI